MTQPQYVTEDRLHNIATLPPIQCTLEFENTGALYHKKSHVDFRQNLSGCGGCNVQSVRTSKPVLPEGDPESVFVVVGRNPSSVDTPESGTFRKDSNYGNIFDLYLSRLGLSRSEIYLTNSLFCPLPQKRDPRPLERLICGLHKTVEFGFVKRARVILLLGDDALKQFIDPLLDIRSSWDKYFATGSRFLIPLMHVGFFIRNPHEQPNILRHLEIIKNRFITPIKKGIL